MNTNRTPIRATIIICALAAAVATFALFQPAASQVTAPQAPAVGEPADTNADGDNGGGYGAGASDTGNEAAPAPATVTISNFAFQLPDSVQPGQAITVVNADSAPHTLTASDGSFNTGNIEPGQAVQLVAPDTPGAYAIFCTIHPTMTATLNVA